MCARQKQCHTAKNRILVPCCLSRHPFCPPPAVSNSPRFGTPQNADTKLELESQLERRHWVTAPWPPGRASGHDLRLRSVLFPICRQRFGRRYIAICCIFLITQMHPRSSGGAKTPPQRQFWRHCRDIRDEAAAVLYGENHFVFFCLPEYQRFYDQVGPANAMLIRRGDAPRLLKSPVFDGRAVRSLASRPQRLRNWVRSRRHPRYPHESGQPALFDQLTGNRMWRTLNGGGEHV